MMGLQVLLWLPCSKHLSWNDTGCYWCEVLTMYCLVASCTSYSRGPLWQIESRV